MVNSTLLYYNLIVEFVTFWIIGFLTTKRTEGHFKVKIPTWLSRILFVKKISHSILLQSVVCQIWLYALILILICSFKRLYDIDRVMLVWGTTVRVNIILYALLFIPDAIIYELRHKND